MTTTEITKIEISRFLKNSLEKVANSYKGETFNIDKINVFTMIESKRNGIYEEMKEEHKCDGKEYNSYDDSFIARILITDNFDEQQREFSSYWWEGVEDNLNKTWRSNKSINSIYWKYVDTENFDNFGNRKGGFEILIGISWGFTVED